MPILGLAPQTKPVYPHHFDIEKVIRPNILALHPYRCARDDYQEGILLDANENALGHSIPLIPVNGQANKVFPEELRATLDLDLHRYPDPSHPLIKERIAALRGISLTSPASSGSDHVFLGVGSDEVIDLLMRVCVKPGSEEKILITPPTYGMYSVCAHVNDVGIVKVPLELTGLHGEGGQIGRFSVKIDEVKKAIDMDPNIKLIFLCSPGNPTGTFISSDSIRALLEYEPFKGIVVVDEAYIDFVDQTKGKASAVSLVKEYANVCVMQTLSKSFGLAAIRLGIAIAQPPLIQILTNTKAPYNISTPSAYLALSALSSPAVAEMRRKIDALKSQRERLLSALSSPTLRKLGVGESIGGNDANFVLVPILERVTVSSSEEEGMKERKPDRERAQNVYKVLAEQEGVVVRYRGNEPGCLGCLRITVGTEEENTVLLEKLQELLSIL